MKYKDLMANYIHCLDNYREDPNRTHKDLLFESEWNIREKMGLPTDHLEELYRER